MAGQKQISISLKPHKAHSPTRIELKISSKRKFGKFTNSWKWDNIILNNSWVKEEITRGIRKYLELNKNENTT